MHTEESREVAAQLLQLAPLFGREVYGGGPRERCGLSLCQLQALGWVQREPGMNMTALADRLGISRQQLSRTADLLVERGLIERYPHPSNRREILLRPLAKGGPAAGNNDCRVIRSAGRAAGGFVRGRPADLGRGV